MGLSAMNIPQAPNVYNITSQMPQQQLVLAQTQTLCTKHRLYANG